MHKKVDLIPTTKQVFDECAPLYLREDKHWGSDLDVIREYVEKFKTPNVIELGTGYAWHLANLFFVSSVTLGRVVGVDYSDEMLKMAEAFLKNVFLDKQPLRNKVDLRKADILSLPFEAGSFDVAMCLNNTLGNIPGKDFKESKEKRKLALKEMHRILKRKGFLILSVYNAARLTEEDKYGEVFELDSKLSDLENFDLVVRFKNTNTPYYSHWFHNSELKRLVYDISFKVVEMEERKKRIVLVGQKR
ncbi:MAG: class I SAM-dependent methyltransferase [Candidatus Bathyarchaeia archaeon]